MTARDDEMGNTTETTYYAAAHTGTTRIPGEDLPQRSTPEGALVEAENAGAHVTWEIRAMDPVAGDREMTEEEMLAWAFRER